MAIKFIMLPGPIIRLPAPAPRFLLMFIHGYIILNMVHSVSGFLKLNAV